jgi:hypothetical protein
LQCWVREVTREADHLGAGAHLPIPRPVSPSTPDVCAWSGGVLAAHVGGRLRRVGGVDGEPRRTRSLVATVGAHTSPHRSLNREGEPAMFANSAAVRPLSVNTA